MERERVSLCYGSPEEQFAFLKKTVTDLLHRNKNTDKAIIVAIDGRCGSGKSTLGAYLHQTFHLESNLFHMDDFFLQMEQRTAKRMQETGGNVDYERFFASVLIPVLKRRTVIYRPFSCKEERLLTGKQIPYKKLNIIEGSYSLHPYFTKMAGRDPFDLRIFLDVSKEKQLENIVRRNGTESGKIFSKLWIPKEEAYFSEFFIRESASIILSEKPSN